MTGHLLALWLLLIAGALAAWPVPATLFAGASSGGRGGLDGRAAGRSLSADRLRDARRSLIRLRPRTIRIVAVLAGIGAGVIAGTTVSWPLGLVAGAAVPLALVGALRALIARRELADRQLDLAAVAAVSAELRAGQTMGAALRTASHRASEQMSAAFAAAATAVEIGADPVELLLHPTGLTPGRPSRSGRTGDQVPSAAQRMIAVTWRLSLTVGCPLAAGIDAVESDLRDRARSADHLRGLLAGPRASAGLLAALPMFGLAMGGAVGAHPWQVLTTTPIGGGMLLIGAGLSILGLLWTRAVVNGAARAV